VTIADDLALHIALTTEAKSHLGIVAPELRGQLARYLDIGAEPDSLLCAVLDSEELAVIEAGNVPPLAGLFWWLAKHAPRECYGTREKRLAWQKRVWDLICDDAEAEENGVEVRDTERPSAPERDAAE
jgi:hypothetical protein